MLALRRILVPVDFSNSAAEALRYGLAMGRAFGAAVDVMHVWEPSPYVAPTSLVWLNGEQKSFWEHTQRQLLGKLDTWVEELREEGDPPVEVRIEAGYTAHSILHAAEEASYDMIVMGTHGRTGLRHLLLGSVAARIVRMAPCPVLTIRVAEATEKAKEPASVPALRGFDFETPTNI